jgi:hypothetical protein
MYFCTSVYFKTSEKKPPTDPDKISVSHKGVVGSRALIHELGTRFGVFSYLDLENPTKIVPYTYMQTAILFSIQFLLGKEINV